LVKQFAVIKKEEEAVEDPEESLSIEKDSLIQLKPQSI